MVEDDECDEHQHNDSSYSCEEKRISEMYDDPSISGKKLVVICWNPHAYKPPKDYVKLDLEARLHLMVELKRYLRKNPPVGLITVYYVCFDKKK
jgi:hypothetical protein